jgi:FkbM family methyltransferase
MIHRSSGLQSRLSSGIVVITTLFAIAFLIQAKNHLHRSEFRDVNKQIGIISPSPNVPVTMRVRDRTTIHGSELDDVNKHIGIHRSELNNVKKHIGILPHPNVPVSVRVPEIRPIYRSELDDVQKQISIFVSRQGSYGNSADFSALVRLTGIGGFCESSLPTLIGGVNEGGATLKILEGCPNLKVIGFEIQAPELEVAKSKLKPYPSVALHNIGWGEREQSNLIISGSKGTAGIYETVGTGRASFEKQAAQATVTSMAKWCDDNGVEKTNYVLIDVEGYEPKVIRGMDLSKEKNQERFSLFQFELGGTWARNDPRHANDWSQRDMVQYLSDFGYDFFLIGDVNWMKIQPSFFDEGNHMLDEGYGKFIQGNLLCLHPKFAAKNVKETVFASANTIF